jgi:hypothetical protein
VPTTTEMNSALPRPRWVAFGLLLAIVGSLLTFAPRSASAATPLVVRVVIAPDDNGAYVVRDNGNVTALGGAAVFGTAPTLVANERVTAMVASDGGYLLVSNRGRAFAYGSAQTYGDLAAQTPKSPIVDAAATIDGRGYWMLSSTGAIYAFGSAVSAGSAESLRLNSPANGLVPDLDGSGYRFVAGDGGVFSFDATFRGSMGATRLNKPIVGMIPYGDGYLMVASDGGVFTFSDKAFYGSLGGDPALTASSAVTAIAAARSGTWYVLSRADGALFAFGPGAPAWLTAVPVPAPVPLPNNGPGNPDGKAAVPAEAGLADTSRPTNIVGNGTAASCTSGAVVSAVARGGVITFNCGAAPITIAMDQTAKIFNNTGPDIVIDGGGLVTLSGSNRRRVLYMNTCDPAQVWTTSHCDNQDHPRLVLQNITFVSGNATGEQAEGGGGGAVFVRGGRVRIVNSRFINNICDATGPDVGGGAVRVLSQFNGLPVYVVNTTIGGGAGLGNECSNGGGLSSIGVSWIVLNSVLTNNRAIGIGANPARSGTPGGGNGGAIALDGNNYTLKVAGSIISDSNAREGGGAIFFVSNNRTGTMRIEDSTLARNVSERFETAGLPGIFYLGSGPPTIVRSTLT